jgi:hypothetical protein
MLTPDDGWKSGCRLDGAQVAKDRIVASYVCGEAAHKATLTHDARATLRGQVAPPHDALSADLAGAIGAKGAAFRWVKPGAATDAPGAPGAPGAAGAAPAKPAAPSMESDKSPARVAEDAIAGAIVARRQGQDDLAEAERNKAAALLVAASQEGQAEDGVGLARVSLAILDKALGRPEADAQLQALARDPGALSAQAARAARWRAQAAVGDTSAIAKAVTAAAAGDDRKAREATCLLGERVLRDLAALDRGDDAMALADGWQGAAKACPSLALTASRVARLVGQGDKALSILEAARAARPDDVPLGIHLAHLYKELGRSKESLALVDGMQLDVKQLGPALVLDLTRVYLDVPDNAASLALHRKRVDEHPQPASDPSVVVSAFIAGTILHHEGAWQASNGYLEHSQEAMKDEPRQWLYRAMNDHHLGKQAEAEAGIARAMSLSRSDPDVYYCRAVIKTASDVDASIADLETYLEQTARSRETYAPKQKKVQRMLADRRACKGAADIHTCVQRRMWLYEARIHWPELVAPVAAAILLLVGLLVFWRRRRRAAA